jgi:6-phosphogluconate dehydrogenase
MQIGFVGLGKMGGFMVERLLRDGHSIVVSNRNPEPIKRAVSLGATAASDLKDLVQKLKSRRLIWVMVPSGDATEQVIRDLGNLLGKGDVIVDGGNSHYKVTVRHAEELKAKGVHLLDAGTSGGVWGLKEGYCQMVGGDEGAFRYAEPAIKTLAPEHGYLHTGPSGSGHFVKMVHNGIEYGMMEAYAEGFEILKESQFKLDLGAIADLWLYGSVVRSWLLELAASALKREPDLASIEAYVSDTGEGRWTVQEAVDLAVSAPVIASALFTRFASRKKEAFGNKLLAALRNEFGGHAIVAAHESKSGKKS